VELSAELLSAAQLRARLDGVESRIKFVLGDALTHREKGLGFDLVIASLVLHHLDLEPALDAICAHLAPGGVVLIYEPVAFSRTLQWLRERSGVSKDVSPNERQLNSDDLARIVRRFEDVHISYFRLTARVARLFPAGPAYYRAYWLLSCLDALLLPTWKHLSGSVVIEVRRATTQAENR
jgi:SAM-dependent methyltransferase